jgi:hypothetical protein
MSGITLLPVAKPSEKPQAITFANPGPTVGQSVALTATGGGSGNPVVFTVDANSGAGVCTVSGTNGATVNYLASGSCVINANQAAGNGYAAAPQVQQTITVSAEGTQSPADLRLPITLTVSVAANLITGLIIALALLEDRYFRISQNWVIGPWVTVTEVPHPLRWLFPPLQATIAIQLLAGCAIIWWQLRKKRKKKPSVVWVYSAIGVVTANALAVVGYAAGLK